METIEQIKEFFLPFVNRKQLSFDKGTAFGIDIVATTLVALPFYITGYTKEGPFSFKITTAELVGGVKHIDLPDIPIGISVRTDDIIEKGLFFAQLFLTMNRSRVQELVQGYVWKYGSLSWPMGTQEQAGREKFSQTVLASSNPAAGAEIAYTVPAGTTLKIKSIVLSLACAAVVASRRTHITIEDGAGAVVYDLFGNTDQLTGETKKHWFMPMGYGAALTNDNDIIVNIPEDILVTEGYVIRTATVNIQGADDYGQMLILAEYFVFPQNLS